MSNQIVPRKRFEELFAKTSKENPRPEDIRAFREALEQMPQLAEIVGSLTNQCQNWIISSIKMPSSTRLLFDANIDNLREKLGYENAPNLEKLLIEQVVLCHLRLYLWEYVYNQAAGQSDDADQFQKWERLVGMAQKRYLRAIETLNRARRLGIQIQVNIATEGGQQVNVGNVANTNVPK